MKSEFVHLHVHSHYSLLDSTNKLDALCAKTKELGMRAIALTDHGNLFGAVEFYQKATEHLLKPIIGCELYVAPDNLTNKTVHPNGFERGFHLTVLATSEEGYRNLARLSTLGYTDGFYYNPRVDHELLAAHSRGLIALSGCLSGEASKWLLAGNENEAVKALHRGKDIFGKENFFYEIQDHGIEEQKQLTSFLIERSKADGIALVATNDVHYLTIEEAPSHDALLCIGTRKLLRDENRKRYNGDQFYLKSPEEMKRKFVYAPEAIEKTVEIAERIEFEFKFGLRHMPVFPVPIGEGSEAEFLEKTALEGLSKKFENIPIEYKERFQEEMKIIISKGFAGYFLIVADFISEAKRRGIPVGPGRGSAAGSLVAYALGITEVDPIPYGLIFERFLNPERVSLPDIDVDICQERREEVISYVKERYGEDRVAQIITFGTFGARGVIRDVARIQDIPISEAERLTKLIPDQLKITLSESIETVPELKNASEKEHSSLFSTALKLEGLARHASRHAAGIVIGDLPITEIAPLYKDQEGNIITQFDMGSIEKLGLLKMDLLGLKTLTVINAVKKLIKPEINSNEIGPVPYDDEEVYKLLSSGHTLGVFQLDSSGIRELIAKVKPSQFEDLAALIALYRPGPMSLTEDFANRKHGRIKVTYLVPILEKILEDTYGIILYQEQVMKIAVELAGYSMAEADILRRAMSKKNRELMEKNRDRFIKGAVAKGINPKDASEIFNQIETFAGYGFNKSHAIAYAVVAYKTAWLKVHYPVEFMAVTLSYEMNNRDKLALYTEETGRMGIKILPPHVNFSMPLFLPENGSERAAIRCGLAAIKNVGIGACEAIAENRENKKYLSLWNFLTRVDSKKVNRRAVEALILSGAYDGLSHNRHSIMNALPQLWDKANAEHDSANSNQLSLFGDSPISEEPTIEKLSEFENLAAYELEYLGFYLNEHPLLKAFPPLKLMAAPNMSEGKNGWVVGMISKIDRILDKRGKEMAKVMLDTLHGRFDTLIFASTFQRYSKNLLEGKAIIMRGRFENGGRIIGDDVFGIEDKSWKAIISLENISDETLLASIKASIENGKEGNCKIELQIFSKGKQFRIKLPRMIDPMVLLSKELEAIQKNILLEPNFTPKNGNGSHFFA